MDTYLHDHDRDDYQTENMNTRPYLEKYTALILEQISSLKGPPSVPFHGVPADMYDNDHQQRQRENADPDQRPTHLDEDKRMHKAEYYNDLRDNDNNDNGSASE
jgi:histone deacetylase 1/2